MNCGNHSNRHSASSVVIPVQTSFQLCSKAQTQTGAPVSQDYTSGFRSEIGINIPQLTRAFPSHLSEKICAAVIAGHTFPFALARADRWTSFVELIFGPATISIVFHAIGAQTFQRDPTSC
jgi:hypothetical protein